MRHRRRCQTDGDHQPCPRCRQPAEAGGLRVPIHSRLGGPRPPRNDRERQADQADQDTGPADRDTDDQSALC